MKSGSAIPLFTAIVASMAGSIDHSGAEDAPSTPAASALDAWAASLPRTYAQAIRLLDQAELSKKTRPSRSIGRVVGGSLENATALPLEGFGFTVAPRRHRERDLRYGSDDLIFGLAEVAASLMKDQSAASRLVVGNIGRREGGPISYSFSHQNGRDVDLVFFVTDLAGRPYEPADFVTITDAKTLEGREEGSGTRCKLDLAREWALIAALLECRRFGDRVNRLYIWDALRERLIEHGRAWADVADDGSTERSRRNALLRRAASLLSQPAHAGPHDDHLHLRIGCNVEDAKAGCED